MTINNKRIKMRTGIGLQFPSFSKSLRSIEFSTIPYYSSFGHEYFSGFNVSVGEIVLTERAGKETGVTKSLIS